MATSTFLGKTELLAWAAQVAGITPCDKYADLRDGLIFLSLARHLFPHAIDSAIVRLQRRGARDGAKNWSLLTSCLRQHGIPLHLCNRQAVERGHTRYCFNLLVLFYFLTRLASGDRFSVDFAQPVDPQLAAFLQSPKSAAAVEHSSHRAGASASASGANEEEGERASEMLPGGSAVVTRLSSPPSAATPSLPGLEAPAAVVRSRYHSVLRGDVDTDRRAEAEVYPPLFAQPSWATAGQQPSFSSSVADGQAAVPPHHVQGISPALPQSLPDHHGDLLRWHSQANSGEARPTDPTPTPLAASSPSAGLLTENRLLREELLYVRTVSQLLLTQQRGSSAAAEMRAAATLQDALAHAEVRHLHDLRQLEAAIATTTAAPSSSPSVWPHHSDDKREAQWRALIHRVEVAESTAAGLYEELRSAASTHDTTLQQLQQVLQSIETIAAAATPSTTTTGLSPAAHHRAAAYENAVAAAMMQQLNGLPGALRDAFRAQLRALLVTLQTLRVGNERMRLEMESSQEQVGSASVVQHVGCGASVHSRRRPSDLTTQSVVSICEDARLVCQTASPAVQRACFRLLELVGHLHTYAEEAQSSADTWKERCHQQEQFTPRDTTTVHSGAAPRSAELGVSDGSVNAVVEEAQRLGDAIAEVLAAASSSTGTHCVIKANDQLASLVDLVVQQQQAGSALESALAEQLASLSSLRREMRQQEEALQNTRVELKDAEQRCRTLEREVRTSREQRDKGNESARVSTGTARSLWLPQRPTTPHLAASSSSTLTLLESPHGGPAVVLGAPLSVQRSSPKSGAAASTQGAPVMPRAVTSQSVSSPYRSGSLRSPSPSTSDEGRGGSLLPSQRDSARQRGAVNLAPSFAGNSAAVPASKSDVSRRPSTPLVEDGTLLPRTASTTRTPTAQAPLAGPAHPCLLSAAELERRKQEILRRYSAEN